MGNPTSDATPKIGLALLASYRGAMIEQS